MNYGYTIKKKKEYIVTSNGIKLKYICNYLVL